MRTMLTRNWWALALRGAVAIAFGLAAFAWPGSAFRAMVLLFGAYAIVNGGVAIAAGLVDRGGSGEAPWWDLVAEGAIGVLVGLVTLFWPGITGTALIYLVAVWAILIGICQVSAAVRLRRVIEDEWTLGTIGGISLAFGLSMALFPGLGEAALAWVVGLFALTLGVLLIWLALRLRTVQHGGRVGGHPAPPAT